MMSLNHIRPWRNIYRRKSRQIMVGNVPVGGDAPISVQTMTNTLTTDIKGTIAQVQAAADAGADIVRISVPDEASAKALPMPMVWAPCPGNTNARLIGPPVTIRLWHTVQRPLVQ